MDILSWIIFGSIVGIVINAIDTTSEGRYVRSIILGVTGAIVGGITTNFLLKGNFVGFNEFSFFVAILCSLLLLSLGKALK